LAWQNAFLAKKFQPAAAGLDVGQLGPNLQFGFPFALQQNSSLATTNWVSVTNAILSGVSGNQTVFIVPPSGRQLFYRLTLP